MCHERFITKAQARAVVFEYIEMFYNCKLLHASLGYLCPETYEARRVG
jgi:putative transposase